MSSTEDDVESTGDDTEHMSNYYGKSPMSNQSTGWQEQPMDPGRLDAGSVQSSVPFKLTELVCLCSGAMSWNVHVMKLICTGMMYFSISD